MYINSDAINIFPLAKPRLNNRDNRLFYEENVTNLIRQVVDNKSFIISAPEQTGTKLTEDLLFNIFGYFVKIDKGTEILDINSVKKYLYAKIILSTEAPFEIAQQDDNNKYQGLSIESYDNLQSDTDSYKYLLLYVKQADGKLHLATESLKKFDISSFSISGLDGKR
jgi:hypothetical protein